MYKSIVAISVILLIACGSSNYKYATEEELHQYTGPYYVTFDFFPKNSHPMVMGGIGETFDIGLLKKNNLKDFTESFYMQFAYAPHIMDLEYDYKKTLSCLGYDITWYKRYYIADIISNVIEDIRLKLEDGNYVIDLGAL